ncbi:MAG: GTP cyclohydrolase, FolE2/MptA family [Desulfurococcus sp.]|nr:GTP cyclohydrolase, FolE2/MptA family [Desulfurococcus sp.]
MEIPDVHSERPSIEVRVNNVGLGRLRSPPLLAGEYIVTPVFKISVDLPGHLKGAHLSRIYEAFTSVMKPFNRLDLSVLRRLALRLLEANDYSSRAVVTVKGRLYYSQSQHEYSSNGFLYARISVEREGGSITPVAEYSGGGFYTLTTCPCAMAVSEYLYGKPFTHMQKVRVNAYIKSRGVSVEPLEVFELLKNMLQAPRNYLKRAEEAELVRAVHEKPFFTEDIARLVSASLAELLARKNTLDPQSLVYVTVKSFETIHEYTVESVVKARAIDLLKDRG